MNLKDEFKKMIGLLSAKYAIPHIAKIFLPPFHKGGQPKDAQFMAIVLEGGATGISFILLPDEKMPEYAALKPEDFAGKDPQRFALEFGNEDPLKEMISMAAINAVCQHVMKETNFPYDTVTDSLGLLAVGKGDRIGMVGLFAGLIDTIRKAGAGLIIIEKKESLLEKYRNLPITLDVTQLASCNKILCTGVTVLNNSLDNVLANCSPDAFVSVLGPTAGYFPDPLFACGVDVVGGRVVGDSTDFVKRLEQGKRWEDSTLKICFQKKTYKSIIS
ncbi:MAG: DUF364 domain-containing protein [Spirochaetota bacterium]